MLWVLFLLVAWGAAVVSCTRLCLAAVAAAQPLDPDPAADAKGLSLYEAAFLSGGPRRVGDLVLVTMYRERRLLLAHTGWVTVVVADGRDELERSVITAIGPEGQSPVRPVRAALATAAAVRALGDRLVAAGLAVPASARTNVAVAVRHVRAACALVLATAAAALLLVPPAAGRGPVASWFMLPLLLTVSCLLIARVEAHPYSRWASPAGQLLLGRIDVPPRRTLAQRSVGGPDGDDDEGEVLTALAVHGTAALPDRALRAALKGHWGH
ncbi:MULTISPECIES: TIGR04222 domain-containing membrane protein [Streptomyces]|uniref:TIGR04222 domain-containing protein n=1 Tax=Streptomyces melanosporofaciens TaxID=67327 RepID=A0A1H4V3M7_STRMJ|nr:TIGR04222 domain-containing membrane protein [Streptomyces melanosporofaciens]SEC75597.1 TIGR04222 domain-containing protein [Streptomyces melanosporofaciens]